MKKHFFTLPSVFELTSKDGWESLDNDKKKFFVMRTHFMMKTRPVEDNLKNGEILLAVQKPKDVNTERVVSIETEKEYINFEETFGQIYFEDESINEIATNILADIGNKLTGRVSIGSKLKIGKKLKESFLNNLKTSETIRTKKNIKYDIKNQFNFNIDEKVYHVKVYQKYAFDIYLTFIDYLFVEMSKSFIGFRTKRRKYPVIGNMRKNRHPNIMKFNTALCSIHFWKLLPKSSVWILEKDYKNQVERPDEFLICPPEDKHKYFVSMPKLPSLYQLSSVAFPFKRKKYRGNYSLSELRKIKENDDQTKWFFSKDEIEFL